MKRPATIHVALVSAYPGEHEARLELGVGEAYLGIWRRPWQPRMHVFGDDVTAADLDREGWMRA